MRSIDRPNQYQFVAWASDRSLVHAGVGGAARISARAARDNQRKWQAWKAATYPEQTVKRVAYMTMYPVRDPDSGQTFAL
jgi:hypothetical protein